MSVYTSVNIEELKIWLQDYALDDLTDYQGIKSGITNTNYFLMTAHDRFVLTLFEKNTIGPPIFCRPYDSFSRAFVFMS